MLDCEATAGATAAELLGGSLNALVGVLRAQNVAVQGAVLPLLRLLVVYDDANGKRTIGNSGAIEHLIRIFASQTTNSREALVRDARLVCHRC